MLRARGGRERVPFQVASIEHVSRIEWRKAAFCGKRRVREPESTRKQAQVFASRRATLSRKHDPPFNRVVDYVLVVFVGPP